MKLTSEDEELLAKLTPPVPLPEEQPALATTHGAQYRQMRWHASVMLPLLERLSAGMRLVPDSRIDFLTRGLGSLLEPLDASEDKMDQLKNERLELARTTAKDSEERRSAVKLHFRRLTPVSIENAFHTSILRPVRRAQRVPRYVEFGFLTTIAVLAIVAEAQFKVGTLQAVGVSLIAYFVVDLLIVGVLLEPRFASIRSQAVADSLALAIKECENIVRNLAEGSKVLTAADQLDRQSDGT